MTAWTGHSHGPGWGAAGSDLTATRRVRLRVRVTERPPETVAPGVVTDFLARLARAPQRGMPGGVPPLRPGQLLGRFEIVREIGRGGFGTVYEARDRSLPRKVALKVLHAPPDAKGAGERLVQEAEVAAQFSSAHIVTLLDLVLEEGHACLVFEYLRGVTLSERLHLGSLEVAEALRIARAVASGLAHAHDRGVIHRDLTPANVFLCDDGGVKILDFGMAYALGHRKLDGGTRSYMAPEQRRGAPEDERTDVFSLGVILYEMLSGVLPLPGARSLDGGGEAPRLEVAGHPGIGDLLARMLAKDPVARPRNGRGASDALAALGTPASGSGQPRVEVRIRRRNRWWPAAALMVLAVAGAGQWWRRSQLEPGSMAPGKQPGSVPDRPVQPPSPPRPIEPSSPAPALAAPSPGTAAPSRGGVGGENVRCGDTIGAFTTPPATSGLGVLLIEAEPFGVVYVDGAPQGEAPRECVVRNGLHRVSVVNGKLGVRAAVVRVGAGKRTRWLAQFGAPP